MDATTLLIIGVVNFFINAGLTLSGGTGLIIRPVLLFFGVPPTFVIGTLRVAGIPGTWVSLSILHKAKKINWKLVATLLPFGILGELIVIFFVIQMPSAIVTKMIGGAMLIGGTVLLFNKQIGTVERKVHVTKKLKWAVAYPYAFVLGMLNVLAGGMGPLGRMLFLFVYKMTHIKAAATQKALNATEALVTGGIFIFLALVDWQLFWVLALTCIAGNYIGTKFMLRKGEEFVRVLVLIVIFASALKLTFF